VKSALFGDIMQRILVIPYRSFGTCPETWVRDYQYKLRNSPEERRSHLFPGGNLESSVKCIWMQVVLLSYWISRVQHAS